MGAKGNNIKLCDFDPSIKEDERERRPTFMI